jgi:aconitate decarboxylase
VNTLGINDFEDLSAARPLKPGRPPSAPDGPTGRIATWVAGLELADVPPHVRDRAAHLLLDGIGCLLVGSHLPWSQVGVDALTTLDSGGGAIIAGWGNRTTSAPTATLLNGSFIQGFELDDYYPPAPLHVNAIVLPALLAVAGQHDVTGAEFLLAAIRGYEVPGRVGRALRGPDMLTRGWHSGVVFGPAASAVAAGTLYRLDAAGFEDALGMAMTQACGLMSAQFESMVKRMQHGFASRNGLTAAALAAGGYVGIKQVFERDFGGFLGVFGEGHDPLPEELSAELGSRWDTELYAVKPYAAMAGLHAGIDAVLKLSAPRPVDPSKVATIDVSVGPAAYGHGGFAIERPITPITAQMSLRYAVCVALLDHGALMAQFRTDRINRDDVWDLIDKTTVHQDDGGETYKTTVRITEHGGHHREETVESPKGGNENPLSNEEIVEKFDSLTAPIVDTGRQEAVRTTVLGIANHDDGPRRLLDLLAAEVPNALA